MHQKGALVGKLRDGQGREGEGKPRGWEMRKHKQGAGMGRNRHPGREGIAHLRPTSGRAV